MKMSVEEYLEDVKQRKSKQTYKEYKHGIERFSEWFGKSPNEILAMRKEDLQSDEKQVRERFLRELEKFHKHLFDKGYAINTARTLCLGIMQLFRFYDMGITLPSGSDVSKTVESIQDFEMQIEHLRAMFVSAPDLRAKTILAMAKDLGWRVSDFANIKLEEIPELDEKNAPIPFARLTQKESMIAHSFLSSETVVLLKDYVKTLPKEAVYLWQNNGHGYLDEENFTRILRDCQILAKIKISKNQRIRFHCFRKLFISTAKNLGVDPDICRKLVGKQVEKSISAYMTTVDYRNAFLKVSEVLTLMNGKAKTTIEAKDLEIQKLQKQVADLQTYVKIITKMNEEQLVKKALAEMKKQGIQSPDELLIPKVPEKPWKKGFNAFDLIMGLVKIQRDKEEKEYEEILKNGNGNGK
jgi:site-specific recombinase XerD